MAETNAPTTPKAKRGGYVYQPYQDRRSDYPTMIEASKDLPADEHGMIFYERGYFGVVWYDGFIRKVRDLKHW